MKPLIAFGLCVSCGIAAAQSWCPPGARWKFDTGNPWTASQVLCNYVGDTVIDGNDAQQIEQVFQLTQHFGTDTLIQHNWGSRFTRTNGNVVWEWNGTVWDTLYWFSAEPGDEWQPFWAFGEVCPDHVIHVVDTSTVVVDGVPLRSLSVEVWEAGVSMGVWGSITERIGGFGGNVFPGLPPCGGIYECFCSFICYQDQDINPDGDCVLPLTVGVHEEVPALNDQDLIAYPDPGDDILHITLSSAPASWTLAMTAISGEVVLRSSGRGSAMQLNTSGLASGSYVLHVTTGNGADLRHRWIKR